MAVQPRRQAQGVAGGDNSGERAEAVLAYANVVRGRAKVFKMLELMATNISDDHSYVARARRLAYVVAANKNLREIIPAMLDLLEHANPVVQEDVVHALGMLRVLEIPAETKDLMIDALTKAGGRSQRLREIVLIALKELGVNEAKVKELGDAITGWGIIREGIIKEGILGKFREFLRSGEPSGEYRHAEGKKTWAVTFRRRKDSDDEGGKDKDGKNVEIYYSFVDDDAREKNKTGDFYIYGVFVAASSAIKVQAEEVTGAAVGLNAAARPAADLRASETRNSLYKFGNYGDTNHRFRIVSSASPMKPVLTVLTTPLTTEQEKRKIKLEIIGEVMRDMAKGSRYAHVDTIIDAADPIFRKQPVLGPDPDVVLLHEDDVFDAVDELKLKSSFVSPCSVNSEGMVSLPLLKTESSVKEREYSEEWRRVTTEHDWREEPISEIMRDEHLNPRSIHRALAAMTADPDYRYRVYVQGGYVVSESKTESNRGKAYPEFNRRDYFVQVLTTGQKAIVERIVGDIAERSEHAHVATIMGAARKAIIAESAMEIEVTESVVEEALDKLYREREKPFPGGSYSHMDYKGIVTLPPASRGNLVRSDYEEMRRMRSRGFKLPIKKIMALESLSPEAVHNTFAAMAADQRYEDIYYVEDGFVKTKKRTNQKEDYPSFDPKAYGVSSSGVAVASSGLAIILADEIDIRLRKALHDTAKRSRRVHQGTIVRDVKEGFKPFKKEMGMDANDDISISDETVQRAVDELDVQLRKFYRNPGMERVFSGDTYLRDPYTGMISLPKSLVKATPDGDPRALSEEWRRIEEYPADIFATPIEEIVKRQGLNPRSVHAALAEMAGDPDSEDIIYVEGGRIKHKPRLQGDQGARYQEYDPKAYGVSSSGVAVTNPLGGIKMSGLQVSAAPGSSPVSFAAIGPEFFKNIIFTIVSLRKAGSLLRFASGR